MTSWAEIQETLPADVCDERENLILEAFTSGEYVAPEWGMVVSEHRGITATFMVTNDALALGDSRDSCRPNVNHVTADKIAKHLGCVLPTAKLCDLIHVQAFVRVEPQLSEPDAQMASTKRMVEQDQAVNRAINGRSGGIVSSVCKHWCNTNKLKGRPNLSANYGWHDPSAPYRAVTPEAGRLWQPGPGTKHNAKHTDNSQKVQVFNRLVNVSGSGQAPKSWDIEKLAADENLWPLVSTEGPLFSMRHPALLDQTRLLSATDLVPPSQAIFTRTLRIGATGDDVAFWQRLIGVTPDGIFGRKTHESTMAWQARHGVVSDGIVGPKTIAKAFPPEIMCAGVMPPTDDIEFLQAANYTPANRTVLDLIVLHSMENAEKPSTAESCAMWCAGRASKPPQASWHFGVDCDSIVQSVQVRDVAWHAPGANHNGIGIEHAGYARQTREEWLDDYSHAMLHLSARLSSKLCKEHGIPVAFVDAEGLKLGHRGITTHLEVTKAFRRSTHGDPGVFFPMDEYLATTRAAA